MHTEIVGKPAQEGTPVSPCRSVFARGWLQAVCARWKGRAGVALSGWQHYSIVAFELQTVSREGEGKQGIGNVGSGEVGLPRWRATMTLLHYYTIPACAIGGMRTGAGNQGVGKWDCRAGGLLCQLCHCASVWRVLSERGVDVNHRILTVSVERMGDRTDSRLMTGNCSIPVGAVGGRGVHAPRGTSLRTLGWRAGTAACPYGSRRATVSAVHPRRAMRNLLIYVVFSHNHGELMRGGWQDDGPDRAVVHARTAVRGEPGARPACSLHVALL